jgi:hypothetical protein
MPVNTQLYFDLLFLEKSESQFPVLPTTFNFFTWIAPLATTIPAAAFSANFVSFYTLQDWYPEHATCVFFSAS